MQHIFGAAFLFTVSLFLTRNAKSINPGRQHAGFLVRRLDTQVDKRYSNIRFLRNTLLRVSVLSNALSSLLIEMPPGVTNISMDYKHFLKECKQENENCTNFCYFLVRQIKAIHNILNARHPLFRG